MLKIEINIGTFPVNKKCVHSTVDKCIKIHGKTRNGKRKHAKIFDNGELSIAFISNKEIKKWNKIYRKIDKATDVLSFGSLGRYSPSFEEGGRGRLSEVVTRDYNTNNYAEILISYEMAKKQAQENKISIKKEIDKLLIHGILHLLGYDHKNNKDAKEMEKIEAQLLHC